MPLINWSSDLKGVDVLTDVNAAKIVATQLNASRPKGALPVKDLSEAIIDITIETSVQGASFIELSIIDPYWGLFTRHGNHPAFIDCDDSGLLLPVEINYPDGSDCFWRLVAVEANTNMGSANVALTFEDRIVVQLREQLGPLMPTANETRAHFIGRAVSTVPGIRFWSPSTDAERASLKAQGLSDAQITALLAGPAPPPSLPSAPPKSATQPGASPQRKNHTKSRTPIGKTVGAPVGTIGKAAGNAITEIALLGSDATPTQRGVAGAVSQIAGSVEVFLGG